MDTSEIQENTTAAANTQPSHEVTIYAEPIFHIGDFAITNSLLTSWLAVIVILFISVFIRAKMKKIPGKVQHVFEVIIDGALSLCDQVTNDRKISEKVFPLVFSLFTFILINNWIGLLPFVSSIGFTAIEGGHAAFVPVRRI